MVALCDQDLLGKSFKEGELRIKVTKQFYGGKLLDPDDCDPYLKEATIANFVGKESVSKGLDLGLIEEKRVMRIRDIPHAQMIKVFL